eukprot:gene8020-9901_t
MVVVMQNSLHTAAMRRSLWALYRTMMDQRSGQKRAVDYLYPSLDPFDQRVIDVGEGHRVFVEQCGNPAGVPVLVLHGGPGGGCSPAMRRYFDPAHYRVVLFDQRGCGRSRPHASVDDNTTWHLVREIDALDGLMGRVADQGGIQFRVLNRRKGPAVRGPRAQADRKLYAQAMQSALAAQANLTIVAGEADDLTLDAAGRISGLILKDGRAFACGAVVLTTGTFLNGLIHMGEVQIPAGRIGEDPAR